MSLICTLWRYFTGAEAVAMSVAFESKHPRQISTDPWKLMSKLLLMWILGAIFGSLFSSPTLNPARFIRKEQIPMFCEENCPIWLEHFNVSVNKLQALDSLLSEEEQMTYLKCSKKTRFQMPLSDGIVCHLKVQCGEKQQIKKQHRILVSKYGRPKEGQHKDITFSNLDKLSMRSFLSFDSHSGVPSLSSSGHQTIDKELFMTGAMDDPVNVHSLIFYFCWTVFGMIVIVSLCYKLRRHRKKKRIHNKSLDETLMQQQKTNGPSKSTLKWRELIFVVLMLGLLGCNVWLFCYMTKDDAFRRKETLVNMCDERARMLQDQFNVSINHVHALAVLVSTFHHDKHPTALDQKTFEQYTERTAFERPLTSGVAYALKVDHSEREQFEKLHGWTIKKMQIEDQTLVQDCITENLEPSSVHDEYAPVILSQDTVSHIVSIDMMSGKEDRENILRARSSGKGVLTSPFKLLKSNQIGVVLTFAVYRSDLPPNATPQQRVEATLGYLGASYDVPSLVEKLLHQLASKQTIIVNVYDTTNNSTPINMYGPEFIDTGISHISHLDFGDPFRKHEMHCRFKQKAPPPVHALSASAAFLVIIFLLGFIFFGYLKQINKVEHEKDELMELKVRAEAADVAKSQFLAMMSHEIRTPIHAILGMLNQLMDTELDSNQLQLAQIALGSGKALISLINEVLDLAKIESGRFEVEAQPFDLRAALDNMLSLFSGRSHEKGIELAAYVSKEVPEVVIGDPGRFCQIITNLVGNSIKFTLNKGHVFVSVFMSNEVGDGVDAKDEVLKVDLNDSSNTLSGLPVVDRWECWEKFKKLNDTNCGGIKLVITVEDTGIGIRHDAQCRIFTPFMQADNSTSRKHGGTGIGLNISKRLIDLMGGEFVFLSEPGIGSTFSFTVAFTEGEKSFQYTERHPTVSGLHGSKALVVNRKKIHGEITRYHLQRFGLCVDTALSLKATCSYLSTASNSSASTQLALVVIDEEIGDDDGGVAFRHQIQKLRSKGGSNVQLPKLYLLAKSMNVGTKHGGNKCVGVVDDVLSKPLRFSVLVPRFQVVHGIGKGHLSRGKKTLAIGNLLKQRQILVVDDNIVNQKVAEGALKKFGAIVTCVGSGRGAVERLKPPHRFDACFMDLQMPEMDGFEATRSIRSMENEFNGKLGEGSDVGQWHTPILAMTADVIGTTNEECMKCGMDGYVSKPFEEEQLYSAVAPFMNLHSHHS